MIRYLDKHCRKKPLTYTVVLHIFRNSSGLLQMSLHSIVISLKYFVIKSFAVNYKCLASKHNILYISSLYFALNQLCDQQ